MLHSKYIFCKSSMNPFKFIPYLIFPQFRPSIPVKRSIAQSCVVVVRIPVGVISDEKLNTKISGEGGGGREREKQLHRWGPIKTTPLTNKHAMPRC